MSNIATKINKLDIKKVNFLQFIQLLYDWKVQSNEKIKIKFLMSHNLGYPPNEIEKIKLRNEDNITIIEVTTNFYNIIGTSSVMPIHYTEYIINCIRLKDTTLFDFINIFYNNVIHDFLEILEHNNIIIQQVKPSYNYSLLYNYLGILPYTKNNIIPENLIKYSGLLLNKSRSAHILENVLSDYFQIDIKVNQFVEEKIKLDIPELSKLGCQNFQLGDSLYLGEHAYFNLNKIAIVFLNIDYKTYERFIDNGDNAHLINQILHFYLGGNISYKLIFYLKEFEKITFINSNAPKKIGYNLWCKC